MIQYYVASSLDGFIADANDEVGWLDELPQPPARSYEDFIAEVGVAVMGSATYAFVLRHINGGGEWPYNVPTFVFTTREWPVPEGADVRFVAGNVGQHVATIRNAGNGNVWLIGGGDLVGQFHEAGALDELIVTVASVTLGAGKPLLPRGLKLERTRVTEYGPGFVEMRYRVL